MENVLLRIGLTKQLHATVIRHYRAWTATEAQALRVGLGGVVRTDERYPKYVVVGGRHDLDAVHNALGGEPEVLVVTHPESDDELPFNVPD